MPHDDKKKPVVRKRSSSNTPAKRKQPVIKPSVGGRGKTRPQ